MKARSQGFNSTIALEVRAFINAKRALGCRYVTEEKQLGIFDRFLVQRDVSNTADITPLLIETFLALRSRPRPRSYNELLGVIRRFFVWLVRQGHLHASPVLATRRRTTSQRIPYLFGPDEARRLLDLAGNLPDNSRAPMRGATYKTIFVLLYGLGLRVGEVSCLQRADIDLDRRLLVIRKAKFGKSRLVPFGPRIGSQLEQYLDLRGGNMAQDTAVFSFTRPGAVHPGTISQTFHQLVPQLGLTLPPGVAPPRVHDLRHSFAVGTLLRWYREGVDPAARLFHLSTFLGHVNPSSTAVYLTITSELLAAANRRFEGLASPALRGVTP